jgi:hypothetical protein
MNYICDDDEKITEAGFCDLGENQREAKGPENDLLMLEPISMLKVINGKISKVDNFEIEKQKPSIIKNIEIKTSELLSSGYTHADNNVFKIGDEGANYWNMLLNRLRLGGAPKVLDINGATIEYGSTGDIESIFMAGSQLALDIQEAGGILAGRTMAASTQEELDAIKSENEAR